MTFYDRPESTAVPEQGDLIEGCPVAAVSAVPNAVTGEYEAQVYSLTVVVLTQTCDLAQGKVDRVVVAPVRAVEEYLSAGLLKPQQIRDQVRRHRVFGLYYLPEGFPAERIPESIVDLRMAAAFSLTSVPVSVKLSDLYSGVTFRSSPAP